MSVSNKLKTILSLQAIRTKVKSIYENVQKVFDAGKDENQWVAYCLGTGEHFDLPEGMTEIPYNMFSGRNELKSVSIPTTVTRIGDESFGYSSVRIGQLPENIETIGYDAFFQCDNNDVIVFSPSITRIDGWAFGSNENLTEVTFVKTLNKSGTPSYLDESAFSNCPNLKTINVPWAKGEVEGAPWGATNATINYNFWDATHIPEVFTFPPGFIKIPYELFRNMTSVKVKEIYLGDECEEIGGFAFQNLLNLETVHLPDGLKKIDQYAFRYDTALKMTELCDSISELEKGAFRSSSIPLTKLPKNLQKIGVRAFADNPNLVIEEIPSDAEFAGAGGYTFENCTGLKKIKFLGTPKKIPTSTFSGCTNITEISVPFGPDHPAAAGAPWGAANATVLFNLKEE